MNIFPVISDETLIKILNDYLESDKGVCVKKEFNFIIEQAELFVKNHIESQNTIFTAPDYELFMVFL